MPGQHVSSKKFQSLVKGSEAVTWGSGNYIQKSSFERPAFELPVGHVFHRISLGDESEFWPGTYCTPSRACFNRYISGFAMLDKGATSASGFRHITFKATEPIRVPHITDVFDGLKEVLSENWETPISKITDIEVMENYKQLSGGNWSSPNGKALFENLRKKGFGAIVDEMDAGVIGERPLVLFSKGVSAKTSARLERSEIKTALNDLTEMAGRK